MIYGRASVGLRITGTRKGARGIKGKNMSEADDVDICISAPMAIDMSRAEGKR
jgi:hypothetical protein